MNYNAATSDRFHKAARENDVEAALVPMADSMRAHVEKLHRENCANFSISDLDECFFVMRMPEVLSEIGLIIWNIWNSAEGGHGEPVLWNRGEVVISIACCAFVAPGDIKRVYPKNYEVWLDNLTINIPQQAIIDIMFGLEGQRMAVHMSFIAPQKPGTTKRGFSILATDLVSHDGAKLLEWWSDRHDGYAKRPWWRFWR